MRELRSYTRTAQQCHWCDTCFHDILPGERYTATVYALGNGRLMVIKEHVDPYCEPDPDPVDEDWETEQKSFVLARAA